MMDSVFATKFTMIAIQLDSLYMQVYEEDA